MTGKRVLLAVAALLLLGCSAAWVGWQRGVGSQRDNDPAPSQQGTGTTVVGGGELVAPTVVLRPDDLTCVPDAFSTLDMVRCAQVEERAANIQINDLAQSIFEVLSEEARARFVEGEELWFEAREAMCNSRADTYEGGSAARIVGASCRAHQSQAHLEDLTRFLSDLMQGREPLPVLY